MIYKYYSPRDYNFEALENGYFFFSKAKYLNDPFDTSFNLVSEKIINKLFSGNAKKASESMANYGICCFSESWKNNILWAYYADNYRGFVIGYDDKILSNMTGNLIQKIQIRIPFQKVSYIDNLDELYNQQSFPYYPLGNEKGIEGAPEFVPMSVSETYDPKQIDKFFTYLCAVKSTSWSSEKEWRLIAAIDVMSRDSQIIKKEEKGYKIPIPKDCVKEIMVGYNFDESHNSVIDEVSKKYGLNDIYKVGPADMPFDLKREKIFLK